MKLLDIWIILYIFLQIIYKLYISNIIKIIKVIYYKNINFMFCYIGLYAFLSFYWF
jgi:hypothetical protein